MTRKAASPMDAASVDAPQEARLPVLHRREVPPTEDEFTELIYDADALPDVAALYPDAYYMDASDYIHDGRFAVNLPRAERDNFYVSMILNGWVRSCLGFELAIRMPEEQADVHRWLDAAKALKAAS